MDPEDAGFSVVKRWCTKREERKLLRFLDRDDRKHWDTSIKARQQQFFGYSYNYRHKTSEKADKFEGVLEQIRLRLNEDGYLSATQCIVNEYRKDQGIGAHTDPAYMGPIVVGISLSSHGSIRLTDPDGNIHDIYLPRRSLMIMRGDSRFLWKHAIMPTKSYLRKGVRITKDDDYRRVSLTFREFSL